MSFKMHKIIFFPEKNNLKIVCLPYILPETDLFFYLALVTLWRLNEDWTDWVDVQADLSITWFKDKLQLNLSLAATQK